MNRSTPGNQINVAVTVEGIADGDKLILTNNRDLTAGVPRPMEGTVAYGGVTFPGYTLPSGEVTLRVALPDTGQNEICDRSNCAEVRITVSVTPCEFNSPAADAMLSANNEPQQYVDSGNPYDPFEVDVGLDCFGGTENDWVDLRVNGGLPIPGLLDTSGRVSFTRVALREGVNVFTGTPRPASPCDAHVGSTACFGVANCTWDVSTGGSCVPDCAAQGTTVPSRYWVDPVPP